MLCSRSSHLCSLRSSRWVFTLNNYTDDEVTSLQDFANSQDVKYLIFGRELGENRTPHLQGFVILEISRTFAWIKEKLGNRYHLEKARGNSKQARDYCKKEGNFVEFGSFPGNQGKRTDLDEAIEWCDEYTVDNGHAPSLKDIADRFPSIAVKYGKALMGVAQLRAPPPSLREGEPRGWQIDLVDYLEQQADDRTIRFYVDPIGNAGKSWFQGWYISKNPETAQLLGVGKRDDVTYAVDASKRIFFFNVPRGGMQFLQYTVFEQLKDQVVFSAKYHTATKILHHPCHVVVFCNEEPNMEAMSADRYDIIRLSAFANNPTNAGLAVNFFPGEGQV